MAKTEFLGLESMTGNEKLNLNAGIGSNMQIIDGWAKETKEQMGNLDNLNSADRTSHVAAINEALSIRGDILDTEEEIEATTVTGKPVGALGVKQIITTIRNLISQKISGVDKRAEALKETVTANTAEIATLNSNLGFELIETTNGVVKKYANGLYEAYGKKIVTPSGYTSALGGYVSTGMYIDYGVPNTAVYSACASANTNAKSVAQLTDVSPSGVSSVYFRVLQNAPTAFPTAISYSVVGRWK